MNLRILLLVFGVCCLVFDTFAQSVTPNRRRNFQPAAAGGGETLWLSQTNNNDSWGVSDNNWSQRITNSSGSDKTITKVVATLTLTLGAQYVTNSLRTAANYGGNLVGSEQAVSVAYPGAQEVTWTWTSNYPVFTNATSLYLTFRPQNGGAEAEFAAGTIAGGTYYENTDYAAYRAATIVSSGTSDCVFKIYTQ